MRWSAPRYLRPADLNACLHHAMRRARLPRLEAGAGPCAPADWEATIVSDLDVSCDPPRTSDLDCLTRVLEYIASTPKCLGIACENGACRLGVIGAPSTTSRASLPGSVKLGSPVNRSEPSRAAEDVNAGLSCYVKGKRQDGRGKRHRGCLIDGCTRKDARS